ncbi:UDP-3-O-(3-hydroxymyristoyl)glucosamine N-acyltransferase [Paucibacter sp. DJ2R-2]|uniref:UDP-3-O-(3-hydroxymyristoyl)glucosamine N-acyltransferase n=1 Tax=Paucibacter sp. DJ2R-2 TaxID=2893558 RepID=UPI0021E368A8|nr:UDP-3-O-(3-hydroxymyristoyl)glucosamine N-acyltransferase [Paucibacter sp. DJ2R-2]MCV2422412.1 UDP-3-O-(3-hydroxymyristoyl)glucosamine N-acyltransferase [Paucibacter sp. DJ4R-1]MCV2440436.1 UDP-3-O-(3-hydroxymyristoyl)glucosamine N-acyltransferase [Paucibacter sp. DJ2R-2]
MGAVSLADVIAALGGDLHGASETQITRIGPLEAADAGTLSFLSNPRYQAQLASSSAACVIVAPAFAEAAAARGAAIVTPDPYLYFARLTQWWAARVRPRAAAGIHPSAVIDASALIGADVSIGALAVIEAGAQIGDGAQIGPHCVVERNARVGSGSRLAARVTLGFDCQIGERCIVHAGVVIGADGFGFAPTQGRWEKIEQLGAVRIGNDVEIGANTCIDRGALEDTVLEDGVKLDNLIQIGHNVHVGAHTAMAGCAGVAGSARIGAHCTVGGGAIILGHLSLVDQVHVSAATVVSRSIKQPGQYSGVFPFDDNASWEKNAATLRQLHTLRDRIRALEKKNST